MATAKLYPTLSRFYESSYVGHEGNTVDHLASRDKFHGKHPTRNIQKTVDSNTTSQRDGHSSQVRKDSSQVRTDSSQARTDSSQVRTDSSQARTDSSQVMKDSSQARTDIGRLYPNICGNILNSDGAHKPQDQTVCSQQAQVPSAPPIELWDEELLRFLEDAILEQQMTRPLDDTPTADYSSFTISSDLLLDDTWVDDLQPDYDVSHDTTELNFLNNLNKLEDKNSREKRADSNTARCSVEVFNIQPERQRVAGQGMTDARSSCRVQETAGVSRGMLGPDQGRGHRERVGDKENRMAAAAEGGRGGGLRPAPGSPEYKAWMTWRKQVNRQLATVILLRQGRHVWLERGDMSRKPLNQRSIDFVSKVVKSGNKTSLGGKPFIMYGIPRASLSGSHRDLTNIGRH